MTQITEKHTHTNLIYGCMGLGGEWDNSPVTDEDRKLAEEVVHVAIENGITVFDHADIYRFGKAEEVFGHVLKSNPSLKEKIVLQSKCGIRFEDKFGPKRYDFSSEWIESSVEGILSRLGVENIDTLFLHRPDPLMEIEPLCDTLRKLHSQGKVNQFAVSNMHWYQIDLLQNSLGMPIVANQLEMSLANHDWLEEGLFAGDKNGKLFNSSAGTLEYCQKQSIQLQAWGSLAQGKYSGITTAEDSATNKAKLLVTSMSEKYQVSKEAIVLAWLMRHPANIHPVIGTVNLDRIKACCESSKVMLSREDWYALYVAARGNELP